MWMNETKQLVGEYYSDVIFQGMCSIFKQGTTKYTGKSHKYRLQRDLQRDCQRKEIFNTSGYQFHLHYFRKMISKHSLYEVFCECVYARYEIAE